MNLGFTEEHSRNTRDITVLVLTVLVLGFLLNLLASGAFQIFFNQFDQTLIMVVIVIAVAFSACFTLLLLNPPNSFVKATSCNLLWNTKDAKVLQSIYDYSSGYFPQMTAFQVFNDFEKHRPELKELLKERIGPPRNNKHVLSHFMDYLLLLWLSHDALKPTYKLRFKEESFQLKEFFEAAKSNPIIETAETLVRQGKTGWTPPEVNIELPKGTKISISGNNKGVDPNVGKLTLKNTYFKIEITYHIGGWRASIGSMWAGPAPSMLGMPLNPFFQEYLLANLSSISVMSYYLVFEAKFNMRMLPIRPRTFYRHMQWAEHLSELFVRFFDWDENTKLALASRQGEIYQIIKGLELRLNDVERKLGESGESGSLARRKRS